MLPEELFAHLDHIGRSGRFVATGHHDQAPLLDIRGLGTLPLPVVPLLLPALRGAGTPAPYGRGPDTVVDADVRRCHQLDADRVTVPASFGSALAEITQAAAVQLGVVGEVEARLYKMLVYGPGDFFVPHRDTEKEPGMFGTLVVTLPGEFTGGELVVQHGADAERVSLKAGASGVRWAAFYADCSHEVLPLDDGVRVALVYNLVRQGAPTGPSDDSGLVGALADELSGWDSDSPVKLVWVLEHRYSEAELGWDRLKGADHGRAAALRQAAGRAGVEVHLAVLSVDVEWSAEELQYRSRRRGWGRSLEGERVPDDIELYDEVHDERVLRGFIAASGHKSGLRGIPVYEGEIWPEGVIDDEPPDDVSYYEATGNEGASLTQMYRRAVVVLWPADSEDALLVQCGLEAVVSALPNIHDPVRVEVLARGIMEESAHGDPRLVCQLLEVLVDQRQGGLGAELVERRVQLVRGMVPPIASVLQLLDEEQAATLATTLMGRIGPWDGPVAIDLLAAAVGRATDPPLWSGLADAFAAREPGSSENDQALAAIVGAAWTLGDAGLQRVALLRLGDEERFDVGVRAALLLQERRRLPEDWRAPVVEGLRARVASRPTKPTDLERGVVEGCRCKDCDALSAFLRDPMEERWVYAVRKDRRRHLQAVTRREQLDIATREVKTGSPHKLVCTKTTGRYERAVERFDRHLKALARLDSS